MSSTSDNSGHGPIEQAQFAEAAKHTAKLCPEHQIAPAICGCEDADGDES